MAWGPPRIKIEGGAQVITDYSIYMYSTLYTGAAPGFWFEEGTKNFIHEFLSSSVLQWRRQNFGSGGHSAQMYSSKTLEKF